MKKLLMALTLTMALATGSAYAGCGCDVPKNDCGCDRKPKCERPCDKPCHKPCKKECDDRPDCAECADRARSCFSDCKDQKREELYCRLNLDTCQRDQANEIEERYESDLDCIGDKIKADHKCLCEALHASCLDKSAVKDREKVLKEDFKDLKAKLKCMDKEFKQILKCDQKSEYRKIKREMKYRVKHSRKYCCKPACKR